MVFSVAFHVLVIANGSFYRHLFSINGRIGDVEVTYIKAEKEPPPVLSQKEEDASVRRSLPRAESSHPLKMVAEQPGRVPPKAEPAAPKNTVPINREEVKIDKKPLAEQRPTVIIKEPIIRRPEMTTSVDLKDLQPVPASYSQTVRSRIINNLDSDEAEDEGDVYIRFVITSKGELKELIIIDEKSTKNGFLRAAAFGAVKNSSPFPRFPKDVAVSEVTFTCQISFLPH